MKSKKFILDKLPEKKKEVYYNCITQFFYTKLPTVNAISKLPIMKQHYGNSVDEIGIEKALEMCIDLFEQGILELVIEDKTFKVYFKHNNNLLLLYKNKIEDSK